MRSLTHLFTVLAAAVLAFAALAGTASASTTLHDTATGLAVTGDSAHDALEVWSKDAIVIASDDRPVPATCAARDDFWEGCDLAGTSGRTLDIDLGEGDNVLELMHMPAELGDIHITTGSGEDVVDLYAEGGTPPPLADVSTGAGDDLIDARNGVADTIDCGPGADDTVYSDGAGPALTGCEHVFDASEADARATHVTWEEGSGFAIYTNHHYLHAVPASGPTDSLRCYSPITGWQPCGAGQDFGPVGGFAEAANGYVATAVGQSADGGIGLIASDSYGVFVFDYTPPAKPFLSSALPPVADGVAVGAWPIGGTSGLARLCSLDGGAQRTCDSGWGPIAAGDHVLVARQRDQAGNVSAPLTLRWTVRRIAGGGPTTGGPHGQVPTTPPAAPVSLRAPKKAIRVKRGAFSVPVSCPAGKLCRAKVYTLKFKAGRKKITTKGSLAELAGGTHTKLRFKLSRRQAKALGHRTVKATITARGAKTVRVKLHG